MNDQNNTDLELYKQRLETHRHLDKLRWQMFQLAIILTSLVVGLRGYALPDVKDATGTWYGAATLFTILGFIKLYLCLKIHKNSISLGYYKRKVGDDMEILEGTFDKIPVILGTILIFIGWVILQVIKEKTNMP